MFRFIHSADWQLGARLKHLGAGAEKARAQRVATLRAALHLARDRAADAFLVAGDLFEDALVEDALVEETLRLFADFPEIPVYLLPGNHDPANGPASIWSRRQFRDGALPANVTIFREPRAHRLGLVSLLASPLRQKVSSVDPSLCLRDLARQEPADRVKIGLTHGALAIPGKHQPNDFPIDLRAATRAGLSYLGIGHWHNWQTYDDDGRLVMPGTPEPDAFGQDNAGYVACVEVDGPAAPPRVEKVRVGALRWTEWDCEFSAWETQHRTTLQTHVSGWKDGGATQICRVKLHGPAALDACAAAETFLHALFGGALHFAVDRQVTPILSANELAALEREHPVLGQVLADLGHLQFLATGESGDAPPNGTATGPAFTLAEAQSFTAAAKLELAALTREDFLAARELLFDGLQSVSANLCA